MCNYTRTTGPAGAARAPGPAADRGANPRGMRGTRGSWWDVVARTRHIQGRPRRPPSISISLSRLRISPYFSASAALISLSCPSTAAHHALAV